MGGCIFDYQLTHISLLVVTSVMQEIPLHFPSSWDQQNSITTTTTTNTTTTAITAPTIAGAVQGTGPACKNSADERYRPFAYATKRMRQAEPLQETSEQGGEENLPPHQHRR